MESGSSESRDTTGWRISFPNLETGANIFQMFKIYNLVKCPTLPVEFLKIFRFKNKLEFFKHLLPPGYSKFQPIRSNRLTSFS